MLEDWIWTSPGDVAMVVVTGILIYGAVIVATRVTGLRSFAQFSSFDFAMTVAIGSLISSSLLTQDPPLIQALVGLAVLYGLQKLVASLRRLPAMGNIIDNNPTVLVKDGELLDENLADTSITDSDLRSILRRENVRSLETVHAVILETTGDVSVLHSQEDDVHIDPWLLEGVTGSKRFDEE